MASLNENIINKVEEYFLTSSGLYEKVYKHTSSDIVFRPNSAGTVEDALNDYELYGLTKNNFADFLVEQKSFATETVFTDILEPWVSDYITVNSDIVINGMLNASEAKIADVIIKGNEFTSEDGLKLMDTLITSEGVITNLVKADEADFNELNADSGFIKVLDSKLVTSDNIITKALEADSAKIADIIIKGNEITSDDGLKLMDTLITSEGVITNLVKADEADFKNITSDTAFMKTINSNLIISDNADFQALNAGVANIQSAIMGASSTETGIVFNLSAANTTLDSAWVAKMVAGEITVADLEAGDIVVSDSMRIISQNSDGGNLLMNGSTMQFTDKDGNVGIQIGYGSSDFPSLIIADENGTALWTSTGITSDAIAEELIDNSMIKTGTIDKQKLNFTPIEANEYGGISIEQIYDGNGGTFGAEYTSFVTNTSSSLSSLEKKIDDSMVYTITIFSTNGSAFQNGRIDTTLQATVFKGGVDITEEYDDSHFIWTRQSSDEYSDSYWNDQHQEGTKNLHITRDDVYFGATFTCSFFIDDEVVASTET
jgi:hypothetical protein